MTRLYEYIEKDEISKLHGMFNDINKKCQPFLKEFKSSNCKNLLFRAVNKKIKLYEEIKPRQDRLPKDTPLNIHKLLDDKFNENFGWKARSEGVFVSSNMEKIKPYGLPYIFIPIGKYEYLWSPKIEDLYEDLDLAVFNKTKFTLNGTNIQRFGNNYKNKIEYDKLKKPESIGGSWWYKDIDTRLTKKHNAIEYLKKVKKIKESEEEIYMSKDFKWFPNISYNTFIKNRYENLTAEVDEIMEEMIRTYKDVNLNGLITHGNEAMFKCNSYYLINFDYKYNLLHFLFRKN